MSWFLLALKKYAVFSGRSRRREFWFFMLFYFIILVALAFIDGSMAASASGPGSAGLLSTIFALAMLIPNLAVTVRRLHDTGRTGWWVLIGLIPVIGGIVLLVFMCLDSEAGSNQYGASPKAA